MFSTGSGATTMEISSLFRTDPEKPPSGHKTQPMALKSDGMADAFSVVKKRMSMTDMPTKNINYGHAMKSTICPHSSVSTPVSPSLGSSSVEGKLRRSASFLDGFGASIKRSLEFGREQNPPTTEVYKHLYRLAAGDPQGPAGCESPIIPYLEGVDMDADGNSTLTSSGQVKNKKAYEQAQLLLISLLENFCAMYDRNPERNRRLFLAVCRQLWNMGILSTSDFFTRSESLRGAYREAFRLLVQEAIHGIETKEGRLLSPHDRLDGGGVDGNDYADESWSEIEDDEDRASGEGGLRNEDEPVDHSRFVDTPSRLLKEFTNFVPIGKGGFAHVFKGQHHIDLREYAFKRIEFKSKNSELYEKIIREIKSLASLEHANIVRYHGAWIESKTDCILQTPTSNGQEPTESGTAFGAEKTTEYNHPLGILIPVGNELAQFQREGPGYYMIIQMELCQFTLADWIEQRNYLLTHGRAWNYAENQHLPNYSFHHCPKPVIPPEKLAIDNGDKGWTINHEQNCRIFKSIVKAVKYIHSRGIIHRDLKPGNIFFQMAVDDTDDFIPKVGDFGLASVPEQNFKLGSKPHSTSSSSYRSTSRTCGLGTCMYAAPEQIREDDYDQKVDIYSLGIILFEMFYPLGTRMERVNVLEDLKRGIFPPSFVKAWPKEATFIWSCLSQSSECRPSAAQILQSEIFEQDPEETIEKLFQEKSSLQKENQTLYNQAVSLQSLLAAEKAKTRQIFEMLSHMQREFDQAKESNASPDLINDLKMRMNNLLSTLPPN